MNLGSSNRPEECSNRPEEDINLFVILQTVVLMALRGLGVVAFAWSTVVLLGGFVTLLGKKDFWCITVLSLLQTARIFNALADEQYRYFFRLLFDPIEGYVNGVWNQACGSNEVTHRTCGDPIEGYVNGVWNQACGSNEVTHRTCGPPNPINMLLLLPLIILVIHPMLVVLLSIIVSSVRLKQQDYGHGEGTDNLKPAMVIFYTLALAQGVLYLFWLILTILENQMVKRVVREYKFEPKWGSDFVRRYLTETRSKCLMDLSATRKMNMITHASDLMDSDYKEDYISGARVLVTFVEKQQLPVKALIRFSRNRIQKLILILAWMDQEDTEIRLLAAKIVAHIASDIRLAQFPGTLECLSSVLKVSKENPIFNDGVKGNIEDKCQLVLQGFNILDKLCSDEYNCIQICNAQVLILHILAWMFSRPILRNGENNHWVTILTISFNVVARLASSRGQPAEKVRGKILFDLHPRCIFGYENHTNLLAQAIYTFSQACARGEITKDECSKRNALVKILLQLFSFEKLKQVGSAGLTQTQVEAGEALARLSIHSHNRNAIIHFKRSIISELFEMIDSREIEVHSRAVAAEILMRIFNHNFHEKKPDTDPQKKVDHNDGDEFCDAPQNKIGDNLQQSLQKVPRQLFSIYEEEAGRGNNTAGGHGHVLGYAQSNNLSDVHYDFKKLQANLVRVIYMFVKKQNRGRELCEQGFTSKDGENISFLQLLKKLVDSNKEDTKPNPLELLKWVALLVEQLINCKIVSARRIRAEKIVDSLSEASVAMANVDSWTLYLATHNRAAVSTNTLAAVVNTIEELVVEDTSENEASSSGTNTLEEIVIQ